MDEANKVGVLSRAASCIVLAIITCVGITVRVMTPGAPGSAVERPVQFSHSLVCWCEPCLRDALYVGSDASNKDPLGQCAAQLPSDVSRVPHRRFKLGE